MTRGSNAEPDYVSPRVDRAVRVACAQVGGQGGRIGRPRTTVGLRKGAGGNRRQKGGRWDRVPVSERARVREREDEVSSKSVSPSE